MNDPRNPASRSTWRTTPGHLSDAALAATAIGMVGVITWSCNRGFDFLDESLYLLSMRSPDDIVGGATSWHLYLSPFFLAIDSSVTAARLIGLAVILVSALLFLEAARRVPTVAEWLDWGFSRYGQYAFCVLGSLIYYFWFIRTPSYNLLSTSLVSVTAAAIVGFGVYAPSSPIRLVPFGMAGLLLAILFFIKFTAAFAAAAVLLAYLCIVTPQWLHVLKSAAVTALGASAWIAFHFLILEAPGGWASKMAAALATSEAPGGAGESILTRYMTSIRALVVNLGADFWPAWVCLAALIGIRVLRPEMLRRSVVSVAFVLAILVAVAAMGVIRRYYGWQFAAADLLTVFVAFSIAMVACLLALPPRVLALSGQRRGHLAAFLGLCVFLAFAASFGTGNAITVNALLTLAPWFVAIMVVLSMLGHACGSLVVPRVGALLVGGFAFAQAFSGALHPYGIASPIFGQTERTEIGPGGQALWLDGRTSQYIREVRALAAKSGLGPGGDLYFFYDSPGTVWALDARSPGRPWYDSMTDRVNREALGDVPPNRMSRAFVMVDLNGRAAPGPAELGLPFPHAYEMVGEQLQHANGHRLQLWRPR